uniref:Glucosaminyl (N-acetyl) transferase 3, mucin type n=1 Tax=Xiphophorus couchianus TaxID=32473 RepID=A0A3B5LAD1_9TELE
GRSFLTYVFQLMMEILKKKLFSHFVIYGVSFAPFPSLYISSPARLGSVIFISFRKSIISVTHNDFQHCYRKFKSKRKYITFSLSKEEEDFPLAYSIVVHHKVSNFERLLRAIYAPQNIYCIHVDKKSQPSVIDAISSIASCFPNVYMARKAETVVYAGWTRVQADLNCMADLYEYSAEWKYFINLCGQDFPLKTNLEMVRILRSLKGSNNLIINTFPPPFNFPIKSGNAYIVVTRGYVQSVLNDTRVQALIEWFKDTYSPDEAMWEVSFVIDQFYFFLPSSVLK